MKTLISLFMALIFRSAFAGYEPTPHPFDAQHYKWSFTMDPTENPDLFPATLELVAKVTAKTKDITLHASQLKIFSVTLNGKNLEFSHHSDKGLLHLPLGREFNKGETLQLKLNYEAKVNESHDGIFKVKDPDEPARGPLYFTMFESESARTAFPCFDEPHDKAITEVVGTIPASHQLISNGRLISDKPFTKGGKAWRTVNWKTDKANATYLVSFAVGPFQKISTSHAGKEISVYVGASKVEKAKLVLEATKKSMQFFEKYLNTPYPWPKYATIGVPTFLWGGMENTSATHMNQERMLLNDPTSAFEKRRLVNLSSHELAHQWFGDYVTMRWWNDIWLNESFATYTAMLAQKEYFKTEEAEVESLLYLWQDYFREENGPRSHPIVLQSISSPADGFDSTNYTKGAAVLRMLSRYLGEDKFRRGIEKYLQTFAYSNSNYKDLFKSLSEASGENLDAFRDSWLLKRGYPIVEYSGQWDEGMKRYELKVLQRPNHPEDSHLFRFRLPIVFHRKGAPEFSKTLILDMKEANQTLTVSLPAAPEWVTVNPSGEVLAKVIPKDSSSDSLGLIAAQDPNPFARLWANVTLSQDFFEGKELSERAEKTLIETLKQDPSPYIRLGLLRLIQQSKSPKLPDSLGNVIFDLAEDAIQPRYLSSAQLLSDEQGWRQWRSELIGTLGKVDKSEGVALLEKFLANPNLALDDLQMASSALAMTGKKSVADTLHAAIELHGKRGYRYRYHLAMAFAAYESPRAAEEIRKISQSATSDLMGKIGGPVSYNETLKNSKEWAEFIRDFVITDNRFGEEIKSRLLETIEDTKTSSVEEALKLIQKESNSKRIKELSEKILKKNFPNS